MWEVYKRKDQVQLRKRMIEKNGIKKKKTQKCSVQIQSAIESTCKVDLLGRFVFIKILLWREKNN
jgi:hypothetical protein